METHVLSKSRNCACSADVRCGLRARQRTLFALLCTRTVESAAGWSELEVGLNNIWLKQTMPLVLEFVQTHVLKA